MRTFGCTAYVHVNPEKRDKLDAKVVKCYFTAYDSDMSGYKFWDDKNRKILRHCDLTFDEKINFETMTQMEVKLESQENSPNNFIAKV